MADEFVELGDKFAVSLGVNYAIFDERIVPLAVDNSHLFSHSLVVFKEK